MSTWELPESVEVGGRELAVRTDFRAVLDVLAILADPGITDAQRAALAMEVFYPDFRDMPPACHREACERLMWFVGGGDSPAKAPKRKLADWGQDFPLIIGPVNRVLGYEARAAEHVHWWTFLAAYCEIGDCTFAQVVAIRDKKSKGKKLDKREREFYRDHRGLVDFRVELSDEEQAFFDEWLGAGSG